MSDIVPEGFDLDTFKERQRERVTTRADEARRHAKCGRAGMETRSGGIQNERKEQAWYCQHCHETVTERDTYIGTYDDVNG